MDCKQTWRLAGEDYHWYSFNSHGQRKVTFDFKDRLSIRCFKARLALLYIIQLKILTQHFPGNNWRCHTGLECKPYLLQSILSTLSAFPNQISHSSRQLHDRGHSALFQHWTLLNYRLKPSKWNNSPVTWLHSFFLNVTLAKEQMQRFILLFFKMDICLLLQDEKTPV